MKYTSTRNKSVSLAADEVIASGISEEGGLFVPGEPLPKISDFAALAEKTYAERAYEILKIFLDSENFTEQSLRAAIDTAYSRNFSTYAVTNTVELNDSAYVLELWRGPTAAFKDVALQILPHLMTSSVKPDRGGKNIAKTLILTATSGDTGKAALEGFRDVDGIEIAVFYPESGVSDTQKMQMICQEGGNVHVFGVKGNFDDCQNAVKAAFTDAELNAKALDMGVAFSSANSINWGRLCPQIVYYISAYADLVRRKAVKNGDKINICVPTGNFGNILAAYYAAEMGLPVNRLICASNSNKILTDFIETGVYDTNREFVTTVSPSMDILVSSNLERLLYHLSGNNDKLINEWFVALKKDGRFEVSAEVREKLQSLFCGGWCNEAETAEAIKSAYFKYGYLMDTHTAVAYKVCGDYIRENGGRTKTLIASTASPYKFADTVYKAIFGEFDPDDFAGGELNEYPAPVRIMRALERRTGINIPAPLAAIGSSPVRFERVLETGGIADVVTELIRGGR